jgi:hypothetical protein
MDPTVIDIMKTIVSLFAFVIALTAFVVPLMRTYIPLFKDRRKISHSMTLRLFSRLGLALLFLHETVFPAYRLLNTEAELNDPATLYMRIAIIPISIFLMLLFIGDWKSHPDGFRGL